MATSRMTFTKPKLDALKAEDKAYTIVDDRYAARRHGTLSVRVAPSGLRSLRVQYRVKDPVTGKWKQAKHVLDGWEELSREKGLSVDAVRDMASAHVRAAQESGLTPTEAEAKDQADRLAAGERQMAIEAELAKKKEARRSVAAFGADYIDARMSGKILKPYADGGRQMRLAVERAAEVWGDKPMTELRMKDGSELLNHVVEVTKAARYKNGKPKARGKYPGYQAAISTRGLLIPLLRYVADELPEVRTDIFSLWTPKMNGPRRAVMTKDERIAFFQALRDFEKPQSNRTGRRHNVSQDTADILRLTYLCAARKSDWVKAQWGDVNLEAASWVRPEHKRKQGTEHKQLLTQGVVEILERIWARRISENRAPEHDHYIFPSVSKTGKKHRTSLWDAFQTITGEINAGKVDEERITPHTLRASRITEWRDEHGWSFQQIARVMGNTADMVEKVYYRPRDDSEDLRDRIEVESDTTLPI
ncbi:MAG: tyrosine-type recombinase/integrase [Pseudomonadota bacterium]